MKVILKQSNDTPTVEIHDVNFVKLLAEGQNVRGAAKKLSLKPRTLEGRVNSLKEKTGAKTLAELVAIFMRNKLIE